MEVVHLLGELDRKAEEKYEEREHKRMMAFQEVEECGGKAYVEEQERH